MESLNISLIITGIFAFIMLAYWLGAFFILYHLIRFGVGPNPKRTAVIFLAGSLFFSLVVVLLFGQLPIDSIISI
jgi:hypothetical protein